MARPRVNTRPVASQYATQDQRIVEVSHELGGCLVSIAPVQGVNLPVPYLGLHVYRADPSVLVSVRHDQPPRTDALPPVLHNYTVALRHDKGTARITTAATGYDMAVKTVLAVELAPPTAVVSVSRGEPLG